ncbi:beta-lactamase family protein [Acidobacteria bacterium AH-259-O06]|nr:beta-lactamase family protein [Acidobacteria bacterium AH-259-O06]
MLTQRGTPGQPRFQSCLVFTLLLIAGFSGIPLNGRDVSAALSEVEGHIHAEMELNHIPGVSLAIVQSDQAFYTGGFGVKDLSTGEAMTLDTPVELASVSKSFTALAILQLEQEGRVELEREVRSYLPDFVTSGPLPWDRVAVQHLLKHTSGLRRKADWLVPCCGLPGDLDLGVAVRKLRSASPRRPPGSSFQYANSNYVLLAAIVESVSSKPFVTYMREHIFRPLKMSRTTLDLEEARAWGLAPFHERQWGRVRPSASTYSGWYGASKVKSTAADMALYLAALLDGEKNSMGRLLSASQLCQSAKSPFYDLGWQVEVAKDSLNGACLLRHKGIIWGANSAVILVPDLQLGIVVLLNIGVNRADEIADAVLAYITGRPALAPVGVLPSSVPDNWAIGFIIAAAATVLSLGVYLCRLGIQLRRGKRRFFRGIGVLMAARAVLFAAMAVCLFYLALGESMPPKATLPTPIQIGFPLFATSLGLLFLAIAIFNLAPRQKI